MDRLLEVLNGLPLGFANVYIALLRLVAPVLMGVILWRAGKPLLSFRKEPEFWGVLRQKNGPGLSVTHWENIIGSDPDCDLVLPNEPVKKVDDAGWLICLLVGWVQRQGIRFRSWRMERRGVEDWVARNHAVLTRHEDGRWTINCVARHTDILVNGTPVRFAELEAGDKIEICGRELELEPFSEEEAAHVSRFRGRASSGLSSVLNLLLLTLLQLLSCLAFLLNGDADHAGNYLLGFGGICLIQWVILVFYAVIRRSGFELETIAFFLCTMGMNVIAATVPGEAVKQLIALVLGLALFFLIGWALRDLERAKRLRYYATAAGVAFLLITLLFGKEIYGAKNWLVIGGFSFQPSELTKVCFVFVGASTLDRIMERRNLIGFIAYSVVVCGLLALMNDFGTALIFFISFLTIAYMRSGSFGTLLMAVAALFIACVQALNIAPHALRRFAIWRHIWEDPLGRGYQQTRSLMCMASGGLLGLGPGNGWMKQLFACDTDVVFATVSEEWGLIAGLAMVAAVVIVLLFCVHSASLGRSTFYTIGASTASSILVAQTILNVLGTVDLLPFTGVTFPFVSNGGSAMISAWGLMAFVKAADVRKNASFAIRNPNRRRREEDA